MGGGDGCNGGVQRVRGWCGGSVVLAVCVFMLVEITLLRSTYPASGVCCLPLPPPRRRPCPPRAPPPLPLPALVSGFTDSRSGGCRALQVAIQRQQRATKKTCLLPGCQEHSLDFLRRADDEGLGVVLKVDDPRAGGGGERRGKVHEDGRGGGVELLLAHLLDWCVSARFVNMVMYTADGMCRPTWLRTSGWRGRTGGPQCSAALVGEGVCWGRRWSGVRSPSGPSLHIHTHMHAL